MKRRRRRWFWIGAPFVSLLWMGVGIVLAIGLAQCLGSASPKNAFSPFAVAFHGLFILASFLIAARCCGLAKVTRRSVRVYCLGKRSEILWENARSAGGGVLRTNLFPLCPQVEHNGKAVFHFHAGKRVAGAGKHKLVDGRRVLRPPLQWRNASGRKRAKCAVECRAQAWPQPRPAVVSAAHRHWRRVRKPALSNALSERRFIKTGPEPYATTVRACFVDEFTPWQWP